MNPIVDLSILVGSFLSRSFFYILFLLFFVLCIYLYHEHKKWNRGWLSNIIQDKISASLKKHKSERKHKFSWRNLVNIGYIKLCLLELYDKISLYFKRGILSDLKRRYFPSFTLLVISIILFCVVFFYSHVGISYSNILHPTKWWGFLEKTMGANDLPNVLTVLGGLVSIVFALIIFVAESIRDNKNSEQRAVLLKVSELWSLIVLTTLSLLNFIWFKITIFSLIFPIFIALGVIYSFWQVIKVILNPEAREENRIEISKDRIKNMVMDSVRERIGNNELLSRLGQDKEIKLEYTISKHWLSRSTEDYIFIEGENEGWIYDINLNELANLAQKLENVASQLGFSIYAKSKPSLERNGSQNSNQSKKEKENVKSVYLLKRYGEYLPPTSIFTDDSKVLLALPKEFSQRPDLIEYVKKIIPHLFRFKKSEPSSVGFRREMQGVKDQLVGAIKSISLGAIEELKKTYLELTETFLETMDLFGGGFTPEQAKKERGNMLFEGWNEVRWLSRDIRELIIVAMSTDNQDVVSDIAFLPVAIAIRAIKARDHFLFQEFLDYCPFLYIIAVDKSDSDVKKFAIGRSWTYLKELSDFYIEPKLTDRFDEGKIDEFKDYENFAFYIFKTFQTIMKLAFDKKDLDTFKKLLDEFSRLYRHLDPENDAQNAEYLSHFLSVAKSEEQKNILEKRLAKQKAKEDSAEKIRLAKEQVIFGLSAKIFDIYKKNIADETIKTFFSVMNEYVSKDLPRLTKVFDSARSEDRWGWDDWEIIPDGEVHSIDVGGKQDQLYCVNALKIVKNKSIEDIKKIKIPHSRNLAFLTEERPGANNITVILDSVKTNPEKWNFVLDANEISKIDALKEVFKTAKKEQENDEEEYLKSAKFDTEKVVEFKTNIKESFYQSSYLRSVLKDCGAYKDLISETPGKKIPSWGYNQVDEKATFVKGWHVHFIGWGENYGRGIAASEDRIVFEKMIKESANKKDIEKQNILSEIGDILKQSTFKNPVVLQTLDHLLEYDELRKPEVFIPKYSENCPKTKFDLNHSFIGVIKIENKEVPVFDVFVNDKDLRNKIIIADLAAFCIFSQYSPVENSEDEKYIFDIFLLKIFDLNEAKKEREKIIKDNPKWLREYEDKEGYLRQKALINLYEKFDFQIKDGKSSMCLNIVKNAELKNDVQG